MKEHPNSLDDLEPKQIKSGKFQMIEGTLYMYCRKHLVYEPLTEFRERKLTLTGYEARCSLGIRQDVKESVTRQKTLGALNAHRIEEEVEQAKMLLQICGYDLEKDIHTQFMERYEKIVKELKIK
jgi:hypothetical protein